MKMLYHTEPTRGIKPMPKPKEAESIILCCQVDHSWRDYSWKKKLMEEHGYFE